MFALIQSENNASNKGKMAGRYQFDTHPTGIGLILFVLQVRTYFNLSTCNEKTQNKLE